MNAKVFRFAHRTRLLAPSMILELMKLMGQPGLVSLGGGLPSADGFPSEAVREASHRVLTQHPREALQYTTTEGLLALREWVAARLSQRGLAVQASQVLITSGSQQGLDLVAKMLLENGTQVAVEAPTYLGALQAFAPYEADAIEAACDDAGPLPERLAELAGARALYLLPNFQNPTGRCIPHARRVQIAAQARSMGLPLLEDDPYGDLWFDQPPAAPVAAHWPEGTIYLGSFSKVLAPGLRLGYAVSPLPVHDLLVQAKQAADMHSSTLAQYIVLDLLRTGMLDGHLDDVRIRYRIGRDAMAQALHTHMRDLATWQIPDGGMFFWMTLPPQIDSASLLPLAIKHGVSYLPGAAFFARNPMRNAVRLSFATESPARIAQGVAALAKLVRHTLTAQSGQAQ
ncbi:PLP-dependent aminotransferase family protein [Roseateles toxinivorans]|uniref:2-aminoadipate transaminase n=1 Tax=Roseateles toxinivorans TaxID=270368 RepID=A0A4V3CSN1_9BURK|nr:PLP-dependent aminotransferase family protein [Roseateles toxinivorans]TDP61252.1 2-aminoadipate transaminase [Roseateles toxinivorans]